MDAKNLRHHYHCYRSNHGYQILGNKILVNIVFLQEKTPIFTSKMDFKSPPILIFTNTFILWEKDYNSKKQGFKCFFRGDFVSFGAIPSAA